MNRPPTDFVRVNQDALKGFLSESLKALSLSGREADLMAARLVSADLRGIHSHGSLLLTRYFDELRTGQVNPAPRLKVVKDEPSLVIVDGDGGLGYLPTSRATELAIARARESGVAVGSIRNIGHYGAASHYTGMCAEAGCVGFSVQGRSDNDYRDVPIALWGSRPISFALPAGAAPPIIVDGCANLFREPDMDLFARVPSAFFMSLGFTAVSKTLGDALTGQMYSEMTGRQNPWPKGRSGAFVLALDVRHFVPDDTFQKQVDWLTQSIGERMRPMPGHEKALLPGALEAERACTYHEQGIPLDRKTKEELEGIAAILGIDTPW